jgi:hypothetical protein
MLAEEENRRRLNIGCGSQTREEGLGKGGVVRRKGKETY